MQTALRPIRVKSGASNQEQPFQKSKIALFWEKYPEGIINVYDRRAVNK